METSEKPEVDTHMLEFEYEKLYDLTFENIKFHFTTFMTGVLASVTALASTALTESQETTYLLIAIASGIFLFVLVFLINYTTKMRTPQELKLRELEEKLGITVFRANLPYMIQLSGKIRGKESKRQITAVWGLRILLCLLVVASAITLCIFTYKTLFPPCF